MSQVLVLGVVREPVGLSPSARAVELCRKKIPLADPGRLGSGLSWRKVWVLAFTGSDSVSVRKEVYSVVRWFQASSRPTGDTHCLVFKSTYDVSRRRGPPLDPRNRYPVVTEVHGCN